jgi:hypothetical protein
LYEAITQERNIKDLYVDYFNFQKSENEKRCMNMPQTISSESILSIKIITLPKTYSEYHM